MAGSHEVRGSIPLGSTIHDTPFERAAFFIIRIEGYRRRRRSHAKPAASAEKRSGQSATIRGARGSHPTSACKASADPMDGVLPFRRAGRE